MLMKENSAYGPVTAASQQSQDYIYTQPGDNVESEYDTVKYVQFLLF